VTFVATVPGDSVESFDADAYRAALAQFLGDAIDESMISVSVALGSLVVTSEVAAPSPTDAVAASLSLRTLEEDTSHASAVLGVAVEAVEVSDDTNAATYQLVYDAAQVSGLSEAAIIAIAAGVGGPSLLIILSVLIWCCCCRRPAQAKVTGTAIGRQRA
jgi:hypothetical protein